MIGKNDFTLTKTVTILFVHERGNSVHASRGYAARSVPEFPRSWTNNIVTITSRTLTTFVKCCLWKNKTAAKLKGWKSSLKLNWFNEVESQFVWKWAAVQRENGGEDVYFEAWKSSWTAVGWLNVFGQVMQCSPTWSLRNQLLTKPRHAFSFFIIGLLENVVCCINAYW